MNISVKRRLWTLVFPAFLAALVLVVPLTGFSADINKDVLTNDVNNNVDNHNENPAFTSTTDVARAEQFTSKTAGQPAPEIITAIQAEHQAKAALQAAIQSGNPQAIAAAQNSHHASEVAAEAVMAGFSGVTLDDIGAMRGSGMGWGQIAQDLGVHPGSLGLGHEKGNFSQHQSAMMQATSRGIRGGQSMMHGVHSGNFTGSRGMGLDHAAQNYGGWANFSGARGGDHAGGSGSGHGMGGSMGAGYNANHGRGMDSGMNGGWGANHGGEMSSDSGSSGGHGGGMGSGPSGGHGGGSGGDSGSGPSGGHGGGSGGGPGGGSGGGPGGGSGGGSGGGGCR